MDVETRLLRYFAAVAEEGNLTRAAQRLFISQPALTKQVRQLEDRLGVQLFVRSRAGMTLTPPGRVLAEHIPKLLSDWDTAVKDVECAARRSSQVLRVGFLASAANEATPRIIAAFTRTRPGWHIEMRQAAWSNPTAGLLTGEADVAFLRLPCPDQHRLRVWELFAEPRGVALPTGHRLAARKRIEFHELWDEPFVASRADPHGWRDYWLATAERGHRAVRVGAVADHPDEWLNAIANGDGIALAPASAARYYARPGVVFIPVAGITESRVAVAWMPAADNDSAVQAFVRSCAVAVT
ncbi:MULTISPECIES: LysR family transcriptional regulator [Catenuloplanes]|uniref:DNA-binding transcriptional LysR family regulator n=1 Tax=Catenuloplanes niger TaxID=587534 RepID=A0AAE4CWY1_9ACTN|nr:LysR family transcriptional regulator [Catenuloplanes niger]MDR7327670.1 DNA-binding transcriptional LysR family regulator [Catenuloplanes niger]